jgi:hypothetical protein
MSVGPISTTLPLHPPKPIPETTEIESPTGYAATKSPLSLRRFPPEIRHMIFCDCVHFKDGKTPAILVALRGDPELYYEALQLFYERNYFTLKWSTVDLYRTMSVNALKNILHLNIE